MKNYTVDQVLRELRSNPDVKVKDYIITVKSSTNPDYAGKVGNSTHGKIDFLVKNGYTKVIDNGVTEKPKEKAISEPVEKIKIKNHDKADVYS